MYKWYYEPSGRTRERIEVKDDKITKVDLRFSEDDLTTQLIGIKLNGKPEKFNTLKYLTNFKKNMSGYLDDCPELASKIAGKEEGYGIENIEDIIREYNAWYLANH